MITLAAPRLFDGVTFSRDRIVVIDADRIKAVADRAPVDARVEELPSDSILCPGFIDLQVNGGAGIMLNNAITVRGMAAIASAHAQNGTTTILPTLISGSRSQMREAISVTEAAVAQAVPGIGGLHLEGPFISTTRSGVHPLEAILPMEDADVALFAAPRALKLMVTLAPDAVSPSRIALLSQSGVIVFAGHTDASYERLQDALRAGISGFTHIFNAMSQLGSRSPGTIGAALVHRNAYAGIIADGHHVHPAVVNTAYAAKGAARLFFVSDAMATVGSVTNSFMLNSEPIRLKNGRLTAEGGALAGAHLTVAEAVRNAVRSAGIPLADALRMATTTPAACVGMTDRGRIAAGCRADIVAIDGSLRVIGVWQNGNKLLGAGSNYD